MSTIYSEAEKCIDGFKRDWRKETQGVVENFMKALRHEREQEITVKLIELGWTPPDKLGMAGTVCDPHRCFICGKPADMGTGNAFGATRGYCKEHIPKTATGTEAETDQLCCKCGKLMQKGQYPVVPLICENCRPKPKTATGTEPECRCVGPHPFFRHLDCPIHGRRPTEQATVKGTIEEATPDLPLKARVAQLVGWKNVRRVYDYDEIENPQWVGYRKQQGGTAFGVIPDYPNDLVAAMGALEEYADKHCTIYIIRRNRTGDYQIVLFPGQTSDTAKWRWDMTLSQAICEAIDKDAEQAK